MMENINKDLPSNEDFTSAFSDPTLWVFIVFANQDLQSPSCGKSTCLAGWKHPSLYGSPDQWIPFPWSW